ncbi:MAG: Sua5/YciO/YrdC/YwlC family protein, partial [Gammaproteobacteria bacterium]|nr:Sua5/YciO/YrdC/YwlC family protein [Gammaproteobacteria bacterium]
NAGEVSASFKEWVDLILDGGATTGKIGSTVLDITVHPPKILREGMVQKSALEKYISA